MNVLHVFKTYLPETVGGIEQVIYQMCESTRAFGIKTQVLTLTAKALADDQVAQHAVTRCTQNLNIASTGFSLSAIGALRKLAKEVDLIHYHYPWPFMDLAHLLCGIKTPYVVSYHSDVVKQQLLLKLYRPLMMHFLGNAQRIIVASPNYCHTSPVLQHFADRCTVIPYGIDHSLYPSAASGKSWQQRFGRFFLFLGVTRYYKGLHVLIEALTRTQVPVLIAGAGPLDRELRLKAKNLGLGHVHFLGRVSEAEKVALLEQCYAMVLPSHLRSEAFGISLLEAAMYGKPLVSCEIGTGTSFINQHGVTGWVVAPSDPAALANAMQTLWQKPEQARDMGYAAKRRYQEVFSAEQMGQQLARLYEAVL